MVYTSQVMDWSQSKGSEFGEPCSTSILLETVI